MEHETCSVDVVVLVSMQGSNGVVFGEAFDGTYPDDNVRANRKLRDGGKKDRAERMRCLLSFARAQFSPVLFSISFVC